MITDRRFNAERLQQSHDLDAHRLVDPQSTVRDTGGGCGITPGRVAVIAADVALGAVVADKQPASAMAAAQQTGKQTPPLRTIMPLPLALSAISGWFLS